MAHERQRHEVDGPLVSLSEMDVALGLIVLRATGVSFFNQAGGVCCLQPVEEGIFVPLGAPEVEQALSEYILATYGPAGTSRLDRKDADVVDQLLAKDRNTRMLSVDRARIHDSCEAWIYVDIGAHPDRYPELPIEGNERTWADPNSPINQSLSLIFGFGRCKGVLTWPNSD
ncbi:DUF6210 family protein [Polyangium sp. 15x6]|uniref:DUF6210 family protein n=1 Tax=Polyangium sp. 15x6 TaxID=3042687 RepID=UPI00249C2C2C|nr:DUF6210 family protein [Polyangium sp. 15x6]MDI3288350.1 DUF6210 family protein [Polyangium sp. 15x6]